MLIGSLGWLVTIPHNASRYEVQIQKAVIAGEIKAYKYASLKWKEASCVF